MEDSGIQTTDTAFVDTGFASLEMDDRDTGFAMRTYKPRTPGLRHLKRPINDHLWKGRPFHPLTIAKKGHGLGGRNWTGRITVRHRGGGHKRRIRTVDFMRMTPGRHLVERIEHDPGRTAHIALITEEATGKKSYIIAADGMRAGDVVQSYRAGIPKALLESMGGVIDPGVLAARTAHRGNCLPLHLVPVGTMVFNVGSAKNRGAVFCRSAGTYAVLISKEEQPVETEQSEEDPIYQFDDASESTPTPAKEVKPFKPKWVNIRLQSGEIRRVSREACATIGIASNPSKHHAQLGKAGRARWLGIRPTVRGLAMNAGKSR